MLHRGEWYAVTFVWQDRNDFIFWVTVSNDTRTSSKLSLCTKSVPTNYKSKNLCHMFASTNSSWTSANVGSFSYVTHVITHRFSSIHISQCCTRSVQCSTSQKFQVSCLRYVQPAFTSLLPSIHTLFLLSVHSVFVLSTYLPSINPVRA